MTYFNKKEEVIEVILTSYGKYKLSRGQWSPKYYAFFDEDVIYDSRYAGAPEISGTTEARIQEQTPSMRAQTSYTDLPRQIKKMTRAVKAATPRGNNLGVGAQAVYANSLMASATRAPYILPLGNSSIDSERQLYAPAWEIKALKNEFVASMSYISSSYENITKIPQLKVDIDYTTNIHKTTDAGDTMGWNKPQTKETETTDYSDMPGYLPHSNSSKEMALTTHFSDGSMIVVEDDYLVLEVNELNSAKAIDQFFLEVWEVEEDEKLQPRDRTGQSLTRMSFVKYPEEIVNDILLDPSELPEVDPSLIDDTYVEYFMDILADEEIDDSTVCNYIATDDKTKQAWSTVLSCYDALDTPGSVLYTSEDIDLITALCEEGCE
jgi:hypothetical protein